MVSGTFAAPTPPTFSWQIKRLGTDFYDLLDRNDLKIPLDCAKGTPADVSVECQRRDILREIFSSTDPGAREYPGSRNV